MKFAIKKKKEVISCQNSWKLLIVDDEAEVHNITKTVLKKFTFKDKSLEFFSAYNGIEAIEILEQNPDIDVVLLDVVMESDDAGLKVAKKIREELNNHNVRIILRTGQPGLSPQKEIIVNYDIDDYKEKTELTSTKLFITMVSSLRMSEHIKTISRNKNKLKKIIDSSRSIFSINTLKTFTNNILEQLDLVLDIKQSDSYFCTFNNGQVEILSSSGKFKNSEDDVMISPESFEYLNQAYSTEKSFFIDDVYVGFFKSHENCIFLYLEGCNKLSPTDKNFLDMFSNNITVAYNNICLNEEIWDTQKEMIERITELVEIKSNETANHVKRVASISYVLAIAYGLSEEEAQKLKLASPMHDIGKIGIPDNILAKPGKLEPDEYKVMKTHVELGYEIFKSSNKEILKIASIVAHQHHEKWDGSGYPQGLKGEQIDIYGRITAIADVFDSLTQKRIYKEPWSIEKVLTFLEDNKGTHFDPKLVDLFKDNIDEIVKFIDL